MVIVGKNCSLRSHRRFRRRSRRNDHDDHYPWLSLSSSCCSRACICSCSLFLILLLPSFSSLRRVAVCLLLFVVVAASCTTRTIFTLFRCAAVGPRICGKQMYLLLAFRMFRMTMSLEKSRS